MTLKIGSGRSLESRQEVGEMLFDLIKTHFASLMESRYLALSFEIAELHPTLNFKQNNVHVDSICQCNTPFNYLFRCFELQCLSRSVV
ncbi:5-carboxymethyl-2-hydroxymuconate delta-isomerase [Escherichia coli]|nr:5-carboxymethyl-2-hydroxymuconate delta-isomerase [Escherichia coli]